MLRHLLDTPSPVDDIHLLCGLPLSKARRSEHVTGAVALVNCVGCLRAHVARLALDLDALRDRFKEAHKPVDPPPAQADDG